MFDRETYDPWQSGWKKPFGAVAAGTRVALNVRPLRRDGYSFGALKLRMESREDEVRHVPLTWSDIEGGRDVFSCQMDPGDYVGLLFYSFLLEGVDGRHAQSQEYQLTVYNGAAAPVPQWFGEGMSYQIFPDRFRRTRIPEVAGLVGGRTVHTHWSDEPNYLPDATGEVRNRDFFGGNLAGVEEKLTYLQGLGVETLYFCPLFEAAENHRYGTADYEKIDPMLGNEADFARLCKKAHKLGMRVLIDGVFNHVGFVSRYFNGDGFYGKEGAYQDQSSPFSPWFRFSHWPDQYQAWWGFYTLPEIQEGEDSYREYIIRSEQSIVRRWLRLGADGWRIDVADELPDDFVAELNAAAKEENPDAVVVGEVWEDGSTKIAYGVRRKHVLGGHCDGLMNYPLRTAMIAFLLGGDAAHFVQDMETLREHYPHDQFYASMNALGTHDTPRILTVLGAGTDFADKPKAFRADYRLSEAGLEIGRKRLKMGVSALFAFPGSPMIYYADEVGMEGFEDPFNRRSFPWDGGDGDLTACIAQLGALRKTHPSMRRGDLRYLFARGHLLAFSRETKGETTAAVLNAGAGADTVTLPWARATDLRTGEVFRGGEVPMEGMTARLLKKG